GNSASTIFITKANGKGALLSQDEIMNGNWSNRGRNYWLNAKPGEYVIVAANYEVEQASTPGTSTTTRSGNMTVTTTSGGSGGGKITHTVIFPKSVVEKTKFKVVPGKLVYVGDFLLDTNNDYDKADDFQKHYGNRIAPGKLQNSGISKMFSTFHLGTLEKINDNEAEKNELMQEIKEDFLETTWMYLFN
ncbi:MAG: hypothetical protein K8R21_03500, partial [Leptospira sp.]|nr:hypothetical protein [Leptospira sp.]